MNDSYSFKIDVSGQSPAQPRESGPPPLEQAARDHAYELARDFLASGSLDYVAFSRLTAPQAAYVRDELQKQPGYVSQALTRGTEAARAHLLLNAQSVGKLLTEAQLSRMASGVQDTDA